MPIRLCILKRDFALDVCIAWLFSFLFIILKYLLYKLCNFKNANWFFCTILFGHNFQIFFPLTLGNIKCTTNM